MNTFFTLSTLDNIENDSYIQMYDSSDMLFKITKGNVIFSEQNIALSTTTSQDYSDLASYETEILALRNILNTDNLSTQQGILSSHYYDIAKESLSTIDALSQQSEQLTGEQTIDDTIGNFYKRSPNQYIKYVLSGDFLSDSTSNGWNIITIPHNFVDELDNPCIPAHVSFTTKKTRNTFWILDSSYLSSSSYNLTFYGINGWVGKWYNTLVKFPILITADNTNVYFKFPLGDIVGVQFSDVYWHEKQVDLYKVLNEFEFIINIYKNP